MVAVVVCWSDDRLGSTDGRFGYPDGGQEGAKVNNEVTRELTKEVNDMVGE